MHQMKLMPHELAKGMYVAELDRPWTDTPFMFQGFRLEAENDLRYIRDTCAYVVIDLEKGDGPRNPGARFRIIDDKEREQRQTGVSASSVPIREVRRRSGGARKSSTAEATALPPRVQEYPEVAPVEEELIFAGDALGSVRSAYNDFVSSLHGTRVNSVEPLRETVTDMESSIVRNPDAMMLLCHLRSRDSYSYRHAINSSVLAIVFGRHLGLRRQQLHDLGVGMLLADVGKVHLPKVILELKRKLTEKEFAMVKRHVDNSMFVIEHAPGVTGGMKTVVQHHHERWDGRGYPRGLAGDDIPMLSRIAGIVDTYDAITNDRAYAKALAPLEAIKELYELRGVAFQRELVEQFIQTLGLYPVGTLVLLNTGEVAVVIGVNRLRRLLPKVMMLLDGDKQALSDNEIVDLATQDPEQAEAAPRAIASVLAPGSYGISPDDYYL